jgi:hypothetical protein
MVTLKAKLLFFDKAAVVSLLDKQTRAALSKAGAFVRQTAKHSIRKRRKISSPGQPPSSHEGSLRRLIWFAYDPVHRSVVIGPARFREGEAPALLEFGGEVTRTSNGKRRGQRVATYKARPFMGPALEKETPKLPALWGRSVRGA